MRSVFTRLVREMGEVLQRIKVGKEAGQELFVSLRAGRRALNEFDLQRRHTSNYSLDKNKCIKFIGGTHDSNARNYCPIIMSQVLTSSNDST